MDDELNLYEDEDYDEEFKTFKEIKEEYNMWLEIYDDSHDDEFFKPSWDKEVYAYAMLSEEQRKKFFN